MLDVKKLLSKIVNWSGFKYTWDINTANTTDTWVPVMVNDSIQHRSIPNSSDVSLEKYGSVWTSGGIGLYRREHLVFVSGAPTFSATSGRTRIGTIPSGFIPRATAYIKINGTTDYLLFNPDGSVQINQRSAGTVWFSGCYAVS